MKIKVQKKELKKAMDVASLAAVNKTLIRDSHALFCPFQDNPLRVYSTDKDRIAVTSCPVLSLEGEPQKFTADPRKITALINSSDSETITLEYLPDEFTLKVYVSNTEKSFVSMPCFDPDEMIPFDQEIDKMLEIKTVNAGQLLSAIKFSKGFLPNKEDTNFSCVYLSKGVLYSSNGFNKVGAYTSEDWKDIETLVLRQAMLDSITQLIDRTDFINISIFSSSKFIGFFSEDKETGFGFLKTTQEMPKFPINLERPDSGGFTVDRNALQKKLHRFQIAEGTEFSVNFTLRGNSEESFLDMRTLNDRASSETMPCVRIKGSENKEFLVKYNHLNTLVKVFQTPEIDLYLTDIMLSVFSEAVLEIDEKVMTRKDDTDEAIEEKRTIKKPFKSIGVFSLARQK